MINKLFKLLLLLNIVIVNTSLIAQSNLLLPLITYECGDMNELISKLHLNDGINPICTTPQGSKIYALIKHGKIESYSIQDNKGNKIPLLANSKSKKPGELIQCPAGTQKNCGCIPNNCFCEPQKSNSLIK